jgi:hypothetical protein
MVRDSLSIRLAPRNLTLACSIPRPYYSFSLRCPLTRISGEPRPYNANEVFVTGTFDDWGKTIKLDRNGDVFEKDVHFPVESDKVHFKVCHGHLACHSLAHDLQLLSEPAFSSILPARQPLGTPPPDKHDAMKIVAMTPSLGLIPLTSWHLAQSFHPTSLQNYKTPS